MIWLDAHLSPRIAKHITDRLGHEARPVRDLRLQSAEDRDIFEAAKRENVIFITKDRDFVDLVTRHGTPPHVIWLTCGNTSEASLKTLFDDRLESALDLIENHGEPLVEISGD